MNSNNYLALLIVVLFSLCSFSQQLSNGGFEQWQNSGPEETAKDWTLVFATKTTDKYAGNFALRVGYTDVSGFDTILNSAYATFATTAKPIKLVGYAKFSLHPADSAKVLVVAGTEDEVQDPNIDATGVGILSFGGTQSSFQRFEVPIKYKNNNPTVAIGLTISTGFEDNDYNSPNSYIIVDNLSLEYSTSVSEDQMEAMEIVNPVENGILYLSNNQWKGYEYSLTDLIGKTCLSGIIESNKLNLSSLPKGPYVFAVKSSNFVKTTKVIVD